jgi:hypothetical protein
MSENPELERRAIPGGLQCESMASKKVRGPAVESAHHRALLGYLFARAVVEANQLLRPQGCHGVGAAFVVIELDLGHGGSKQFDDSSNLAANKSLLGHILEHGYLGKKLHLPYLSCSIEYSK